MASAPLQGWYDARRFLAESIQRYKDASLVLEDSIVNSLVHPWEKNELAHLFDVVRDDVTSISSGNAELNAADVSPKRVRNQYTKFVSVKVLLHELLVHILSHLTSGQCDFFDRTELRISRCDITKNTLAITHVCSDWRRLIINTPALWTHVDTIDRDYHSSSRFGDKLLKLWLEWAKTAALSVQVYMRWTMRNYTEGPLEELVPHFHNLKSIGFCAHNSVSLSAVVQYWIKHSTGGTLQELSIAEHKSSNFFDQETKEVFYPNDLRSVLSSLRILRVWHCSVMPLLDFPQSSLLTHLELSAIPSQYCCSDSVFPALLPRFPQLQVLKLETIEPDCSNQLEVRTLSLYSLERLELIKLPPNLCLYLLRAIYPGPGKLSLRLEIPVDHSNVDVLHSFLARSNVTRLYLKPQGDWSLGTDCVGTIVNLEKLVIDLDGVKLYEYNQVIRALLPIPDDTVSSATERRWPELYMLWMIKGFASAKLMKEVAQAYNIRNLIISSPSLMCSGEIESVGEKLTTEEFAPQLVAENWCDRY
ncbi:FAD-binding domain protein [Ceratobasidium sp. AG-Ba]|nr:FAD-binding domain protein [Ceratobasidium sp. AG-Ba]